VTWLAPNNACNQPLRAKLGAFQGVGLQLFQERADVMRQIVTQLDDPLVREAAKASWPWLRSRALVKRVLLLGFHRQIQEASSPDRRLWPRRDASAIKRVRPLPSSRQRRCRDRRCAGAGRPTRRAARARQPTTRPAEAAPIAHGLFPLTPRRRRRSRRRR
jgi:hypothetical protein